MAPVRNRLLVAMLVGFAVGLALALLAGCTTPEPAGPHHGGWAPAPWAADPWIT